MGVQIRSLGEGVARDRSLLEEGEQGLQSPGAYPGIEIVEVPFEICDRGVHRFPPFTRDSVPGLKTGHARRDQIPIRSARGRDE